MARLFTSFLLALVLLAPGLAHATAQEGDRIWIDGKSFPLNTNPLQRKLEDMGWKPPDDAVISSSNWRGNVAEWKIEEGQLVLVDATIRVSPDRSEDDVAKSIREQVFPSMARVVADWYSGTLIIPDGKMVEYVHMGYGSSYDHYQVIRISSGRVLSHLSLDGEQFQDYKARKFEEYSRTPEFEEALRKMLEEGDLGDEDDVIDFMKSYHAEQYLSI